MKSTIRQFIDWVTLKDLRMGMGLTFHYLWTKPITRIYPDEPCVPAKRFRGLHELWKKEETGLDRCIGCRLCEKICPNGSITMHMERLEEGGKKVVTRFEVNAGRCLYCGFCVEVCSTDALRMGAHFYKESLSREDFIEDKDELLERGSQD